MKRPREEDVGGASKQARREEEGEGELVCEEEDDLEDHIDDKDYDPNVYFHDHTVDKDYDQEEDYDPLALDNAGDRVSTTLVCSAASRAKK